MTDLKNSSKKDILAANDNFDQSIPTDLELEKIIPLCQKTQTTLKEFDQQLKKLITFNEERLKSGEISYTAGKNRIETLENFHNIEEEVKKTQDKVNELLEELLQKIPSLAKFVGTTMSVNSPTSTTRDEEPEE